MRNDIVRRYRDLKARFFNLMNSNIKIKCNYLDVVGYLYLLLPILVFLLGWTRPLVGIVGTLALCAGLYCLLKQHNTINELLSIDVKSLCIIISVLAVLVYISGVGMFWPQRADWQWRNAVLRDLIDYSWPVTYPETNNNLVYYLNYFLIPAIMGKMLGFGAANICLAFVTFLGLIIITLNIIRYLKINDLKRICYILLIFIVWSGLNGLSLSLLEAMGIGPNIYQFSPNFTLLQWVTNQTMAPWLGVSLFLNRRNVSEYVYLGLCVFASAPLPFIGLFFILLVDGISQFVVLYRTDVRKFAANVITFPNLSAAVIITAVFGLYFFSNVAATGSAGEGGVGLYVPLEQFGKKQFAILAIFLFFNYIIYSILIFPECKRSHLYWIMNISLLLIPLFRVGTSNDFGMRACIPAQFLQMMLVMSVLLKADSALIRTRHIILIGALAVTLTSFYTETCSKLKAVVSHEDYACDDIKSFTNKINEAYYCGIHPYNFLSPCDSPSLFYAYIAKGKNEDVRVRETQLSEGFRLRNDFAHVSGEYALTSYTDPSLFISCTSGGVDIGNSFASVILSNSLDKGIYEIYTSDTHDSVGFDEEKTFTVVRDGGGHEFGVKGIADTHMFRLVEKSGHIMIVWGDSFALTYTGDGLKWKPIVNDKAQLWNIIPQNDLTGRHREASNQ